MSRRTCGAAQKAAPAIECSTRPQPAYPSALQGGKGYGATSGVGKLQNLRVAVQRRWNNTVSDTSRQQVGTVGTQGGPAAVAKGLRRREDDVRFFLPSIPPQQGDGVLHPVPTRG